MAPLFESPRHERAASLLTVGFGTTVAMWAVGYVGRLPALVLPSPLLLAGFLAALVAGGFTLGRSTGRGLAHGALAGALTGVLNLLVLGSFLSGHEPNRVTPSALAWVPLSIAASAALCGIGAALGARVATADRTARDWLSAFVRVAGVATLLLLAVGGLVTSAEAGLAVVDWPNSFGYNMFLYPFSRMTGSIYYEHAHRLFGALVGLTTLVLALFLQRVETRAWVRRLGWCALGLVIVQGLLGGLRVTGRLTLSTAAQDMTPSTALALVHGILGQLFFATLVALAAFTSRSWRTPGGTFARPGAAVDRALGVALAAAVVVQLALGAGQRHLQGTLLLHVVFGIGVVVPLGLHAGLRAWGITPNHPLLRRLGLALVAALFVQVLLGVAAWIATASVASGTLAPVWDLTLATAHQWFGAFVLALSVALALWNLRLLPVAEARAADCSSSF